MVEMLIFTRPFTTIPRKEQTHCFSFSIYKSSNGKHRGAVPLFFCYFQMCQSEKKISQFSKSGNPTMFPLKSFCFSYCKILCFHVFYKSNAYCMLIDYYLSEVTEFFNSQMEARLVKSHKTSLLESS